MVSTYIHIYICYRSVLDSCVLPLSLFFVVDWRVICGDDFAGESMWNKYNLFTGCVDVPLSRRGIEQAFEAGRRIAAIPVDLVFTSALARSQQTAMIAMTEHLGERVPVVLYTGQNGRAILWSRIHSEVAETHAIPMIRAWELNERMYGHLQVSSLVVYFFYFFWVF